MVADDDPLAAQHTLLSEILEKWPDPQRWRWDKAHSPDAVMAPLKAASVEERRRLILAMLPRLKNGTVQRETSEQFEAISALWHMLDSLMRSPPDLREEELHALLAWMLDEPWVTCLRYPVVGTIRAAEKLVARVPLSDALVQEFTALATALRKYSHHRENRLAADRIDGLVGTTPEVRILPGEPWADAALAELAALPPARQTAWAALLAHCGIGATAGKPTGKWMKEAMHLLQTVVPFSEFKECMLRWMPLIERPRTRSLYADYPPSMFGNHLPPDYCQHLLSETNADLLKGLAWCAGLHADRDLARTLTALALAGYRKIAGHGPRSLKIGNACVTALGMMPGTDAADQLAVLKVKVKLNGAQKEIERALASTAQRLGIPASELDEMGVPAYGLERVGEAEITMGEHTALLRVDGNAAHLEWRKADGKKSASIPAAVKQDFAEDLKELKASVKDIEKMLPAQRERLDNLFLKRKTWPFDLWRERYLDHPLVGTIARRLIWCFAGTDRAQAGIFADGQLTGPDDQPLTNLGPATRVGPWHPLDHTQDEILAWRGWLERHQVQQPFKQAHREVYLLTDAERNTRVYSNRFAAHLLKQHQFNALCGARGWKNKLRMMVDDTYPPASLTLPEWNLRAEYWIEGAGDEYGRDTTDSGAYHYLTTDQVRFYLLDAAQRTAHAAGGGYNMDRRGGTDEPIALEDVPALVLSEVLRDVDLFVGVASVGNDPNWADGGPQGRYRDYWQGYAFGDLSGTAKTRRDILERLLPRLKIADRATLSDRFLVVRGDLRTYKIHLGSGNILMSPNDTYLCIVPKSTDEKANVFLPFEGDRILSIVLSKAFMLATDTKITDPTIVSQIKR